MNTNIYKVLVGSADQARSAEFIAEAEAPSLAFLQVAQHLSKHSFYDIAVFEGMPFSFKPIDEAERTFYLNSDSRRLGQLPVMAAYHAELPMKGVKVAQYIVPPQAT